VFETTAPESGADFYTGAQFLLRNTRHDRYDAADFTLKRTFAGRYEWFLGYTRSSSRTNDDVQYSLINPIFGPQLPGPFPWDAPNRIHMWGWAPLPHASLPKLLQFATRSTTAAYLVEYRTGFPFGVVDQQGFMMGPPGGMRLPGYFSVNLHFERQFHALHYLWAWRVGVDNMCWDRRNIWPMAEAKPGRLLCACECWERSRPYGAHCIGKYAPVGPLATSVHYLPRRFDYICEV
jgi:hypothetical protein